MAKISSNLYRDADGNFVKGRYIYKTSQNEKYMAQMKYPQGYTKCATLYSLEEAIEFIEGNWTRYEPGWYYDNDLKLVVLRRPGEHRSKRGF
jgi:uncharacterized protein YbdZ (MbtH family)